MASTSTQLLLNNLNNLFGFNTYSTHMIFYYCFDKIKLLQLPEPYSFLILQTEENS